MATASLLITVAACLALQVMLEAPRPLSVEELLAIAAAVAWQRRLLLLPETVGARLVAAAAPDRCRHGRGCL